MKLQDDHDRECRLLLGEFCCALRFAADAEYSNSVKNFYENFLSEKEPDITLDIEIILHREKVEVPQSLAIAKKVEGENFDYHNGLIKGTLDLDKRRCSLQVKNALLGNPSVRIFEQFMHQLYFTLLEDRYHGAMPWRLLVHSCAVLVNDKGYLFVGPSGSGKSTIAELSAAYDVLNDEITLVQNEGGTYTVHATPFNGYFRLKKNMSGPLEKIFFIKQDTEHYIKKIALKDCIIPLAREIVPPISILSEQNRHPLYALFDCAVQILKDVTFFELHFRQDNKLWEYIESIE
jgi:hypothetical protein